MQKAPVATNGLKVGELAKRTGLTVRTLHHYDAIGLLRPSARTSSGHRLYDASDVTRLMRISALKQLGLGLIEVGECLDGPKGSLDAVLTRQVSFLRSRIRAEERLVQRLEGCLEMAKVGDHASTDDLLETIHMTTQFDKYYTPEQLAQLEERAEQVGAERIQQVQEEWAQLFAAMDEARLAGTDVNEPDVQALVAKAKGLIAEFAGGDAGIHESLGDAVQSEPGPMRKMWGISEELGTYYGEAMAASAGAG